MPSQKAENGSRLIWRVLSITAIFLAVGVSLAVLVSFAVNDMAVEANRIDDARATRASLAAIKSLQTHMIAAVRDNAVWDDAYAQISGPAAAQWAFDTWGKTTQDYPLYDMAIVLSPSGDPTSAYDKGAVFNPVSYFGPAISSLPTRAKASGKTPVVDFVSTGDGIYMVAAGAIQPYTGTVSSQNLSTLMFAKRMSSDVLRQLDETFDIGGVRLVAATSGKLLSTPLTGTDGKPVAYLEWPSRNPGDAIYAHVRLYLLGAGGLLVSFLVGLLFTGASAARGLRHSAERTRFTSSHDALSGLLNRAGLFEEAERLLSDGKSVALHLIDLDGFKDVNDTWGHSIGDELIKLVATRILEALPGGMQAARLGGDEFCVLTDTSDVDVGPIIIEILARPFRIGGRTIEVGASIGRAVLNADCKSALELVRRADVALYSAKETGRARQIEYHVGLDVDRQRSAQMEISLREALDVGDVRPAFQPVIDARTRQLRGVEALARWVWETGPVSPDVFIGVAERAGLIDQLGRNILSASIDAAQAWGQIVLSVNVSPIQLRNPNFAAEVAEILQNKNFDAARLTLEITEGVLMSNPEQAKRTIAILKSIGVKFALDDFGCGYASIGALRQFGFDRMKIDKSLVIAMDEEIGAGVLNATISLANALNIPVTAEGVETNAQADALTRSGCDQLQGYLLGKPMSADELFLNYVRKAA